MGATDPAKADAGTLRKEFAESIERNATHGSDASETAAYEVPNEHQIARERLDYGLEWLATLGASATGELSTDSDTGAAVARIVDEGFDEVVVSTLPTTVSRWLHQDLPCRIGRKVSVPVCVVTRAG
jgi:hypothetical protein